MRPRGGACGAALRLTQIVDTPQGRALLARFYRDSYVAEFPDADERESLANMRRYLSARTRGWYGANSYHIVVAEIDGRMAGGSVSDYLAEPNVGVVEFLFVSDWARTRGIGRALLAETIRLLRGDARASGRGPLAAVVAEMNDPFRRPVIRDNMDPFERAAIWGRWGFSSFDFRYVQPALSRRQRPVENLLLIVRMLSRPRATRASSQWVLAIVGEYMRWAMRIAVPERNPQFRAMAAFLVAREFVGLTPLQALIGRDPRRPFAIDEITAPGRALEDTLALLARAIPFPQRVAPERRFRELLAEAPSRERRYRLWSLRSPGAEAVEGLASFFSLRPCGFGGYIALDGTLRGRGVLRPLVARIEQQMLRDSPHACGWFIECADESAAPFLRVGFEESAVDYRPPTYGTHDGEARYRPERLRLLYRRFGASYDGFTQSSRFVLECIAAILRNVYGVAHPRRHACYRRAAVSLAD